MKAKKVQTETKRITSHVDVVHCEAPGGAAQVYANLFELSWTSHDVQIRLSHNQRLPSELPTNRQEHRATVTLAWSETKGLAIALASLLQRYEAENGEIKPVVLP